MCACVCKQISMYMRILYIYVITITSRWQICILDVYDNASIQFFPLLAPVSTFHCRASSYILFCKLKMSYILLPRSGSIFVNWCFFFFWNIPPTLFLEAPFIFAPPMPLPRRPAPQITKFTCERSQSSFLSRASEEEVTKRHAPLT